MSNESENKRIDLTQVEAFLERDGPESGGRFVYDLIAELKKCYESEDRLVELLQIIEEKYDIPVKQIAATMSI